MKKKVFSFMAAVMFMSTLVSAAPVVQFEEDGRATDCVRWARGETFMLADHYGEHPNDDSFYMDFYMSLYESCMD